MNTIFDFSDTHTLHNDHPAIDAICQNDPWMDFILYD